MDPTEYSLKASLFPEKREFVELLLVIFLLTILEQKTFMGLSWRCGCSLLSHCQYFGRI